MKYSILLVATLAIVTSCSNKNRSNISTAKNFDSASAKQNNEQIIAEPERVFVDTTVNWGNIIAKISVSRSPSNNTVPDEDFPSTRYRDNDMRLKVEKEGEIVIDKTITKDNFKNLVTSDIFSRYILEGMVLDRISKSEAVFSASIANPTQDDEYVSFKIVLSPSGNLAISKSIDTPMH